MSEINNRSWDKYFSDKALWNHADFNNVVSPAMNDKSFMRNISEHLIKFIFVHGHMCSECRKYVYFYLALCEHMVVFICYISSIGMEPRKVRRNDKDARSAPYQGTLGGL